MELETLTRKWGNSIAIIIPSNIVAQGKLKENEMVSVTIEKKKPLLVKDVFGMLKGKINRPTQEIKDEMRQGWMSKSDREEEKTWRK